MRSTGAGVRSLVRGSLVLFFFFSSRRRHTRSDRDWSSDVCSSDLEDGRRLGLAGMIEDVLQRIAAVRRPPYELRPLNARDHAFIARTISVLEGDRKSVV